MIKERTVKIKVPLHGNKILGECLKRVNENKEIFSLWKVSNVNAIDRLKMSDHGPVHFQIVSNIALRIARILVGKGVKMSLSSDFELSNDHSEAVIFFASIFHDLGMSIGRDGHEEFSLFLANTIMREILDFLPVEERTIVISEALHAIISHRKDGKPATIEAGIVRVADALDMSEGRSRIPYEAGLMDIHSISAAAIDEVKIGKGEGKPVQIIIIMNNSAGIFQVDELLKSKLSGSRIEKYIEVKAFVRQEGEKRLLREYSLNTTV